MEVLTIEVQKFRLPWKSAENTASDEGKLYSFSFTIFSIFVVDPIQKITSLKLTNNKKPKILKHYPLQDSWNISCFLING